MDDSGEVFVQKCNICGAIIGGERFNWLNEFRAVYTVGKTFRGRGPRWSSLRLSGVGVRSRDDVYNHTASPPIDPQRRYDDEQNGVATLSIKDMCPPLLPPPHSSVFPQSSVDTRGSCYGYLFHDACWTLLTKALAPAEVNVWAMYNFCNSFPSRSGLVNWGHDYGGIFDMYPNILPGGTPRPQVYRRIQRTVANGYSADEVFHADPLRIPFLDFLRNGTAMGKQGDGSIGSSTGFSSIFVSRSSRSSDANDCFSVLPPELRQMILSLLATADVLNLFLASRTFANSPLLQNFWASRFFGTFEFSSIFEARQDSAASPRSRDWRSLFHFLRRHTHMLNFQNRKRIWEIVQPLADNLTLFSTVMIRGNLPSALDGKLKWKNARASMRELGDDSFAGDRVLFSRTADISPSIVAIRVSTIRFGDCDFVTGLCFVDASGTGIEIGYTLPGNETYIDLHDDAMSDSKSCSLCGFYFSIGTNGVRALSAVKASGNRSPWVGSPQNIPQMRLLSIPSNIRKIKGEFDGLKLISLGIGLQEEYDPSHFEPRSLRDSLQWFPDIPHNDLCLNEENSHTASFFARPLYPTFWIHYGGAQGAYLSNVIAFSVLATPERCMRLEIEYDREIQGTRMHTLGDCDTYLDSRLVEDEKVTFRIDGPNGEFISDVQVGKFSEKSNLLSCLQIRTNRGRSATFPDTRAGDVNFISLVATTEKKKHNRITGFYAKTVPRLRTLGVISERILSAPLPRK
ncbi:hypothetical protein PABG_04856 [Paracoccidioides brasiliensis Pb03]|nr:hypothetical protein PABG_04856 [Paracoccidioides brasiliensis Pb03]